VERYDVEDVRERVDLVELVEAETGEAFANGKMCCPLPGHDERTPSFGVFRGRDGAQRWKCHGCGRGGDAFALLQELRGIGFADALVELGRRAGALTMKRDARPKSKPKPAPAPPRYPDRAELFRVWWASKRVHRQRRTRDWLASRGINAEAIGPELARALPRYLAEEAEPLPEWAGPWRRRHALLIPLRDVRGNMVSLKARDVTGEARVKELNPKGFTSTGLVYANDVAARMLAGLPSLKPGAALAIAEGGPDFLATCAEVAGFDDLAPWAVIGIPGSGSWSSELAARIPDGLRVVVATDHDEAGNDYAREVTRDLAARCDVRRTPRVEVS